MAKVGAQRAAILTGRSKSTVQRAMNAGKLSYEVDMNGRRVIDVSELERVFGIKQKSVPASSDATMFSVGETQHVSIESAVAQEKMRMTILMLEEQLKSAQDQIDDLKTQRDKWEKQASQVLLTSQYSQKQAEELKAQIKAREDKIRRRRMEIEKARNNKERPLTSSPSVGSDVKKNTSASVAPQKKPEIRDLEDQIKSLKAGNENTNGDFAGSVFRFWKRARD